jgi:hypothetical protein
MGMTFTEGSGLNDSIYGKSQAPIRLFLEKRGEAFEQKSILPYMFMMGSSKNYGDKMTSMTAMNGFEAVGEGGAYPHDEMQEGYDKQLGQMTWKDSFALTKEIIDDAKIMDLRKRPEAFLSGYYRTREKFGAALYGKAMTGATSMEFAGKKFDLTSADNLTVFNTAHKAKVKGVNQSNLFSNAFDEDALGLGETAMQLFRGDNNEILDESPTTIVIPNDHALKKAVFAAIGADKDPNTSNNAFNYQFGRWTIICWPYLNQFITAGTSPWLLLDSNYNETYGGAPWLDREELSVRSTIDENTDDNVWRGRARFNACFNDWRFCAAFGIAGGTTLS